MTTKFKRTPVAPNMHMRWEIDYNVLRYATNRANIATGLDLDMQQMQAIMLELEQCETEVDDYAAMVEVLVDFIYNICGEDIVYSDGVLTAHKDLQEHDAALDIIEQKLRESGE